MLERARACGKPFPVGRHRFRGCRKRLTAVLAAPGLEPRPGSAIGLLSPLGARGARESAGVLDEIRRQRHLAQIALDAGG
jgi:hypothetical protein